MNKVQELSAYFFNFENMDDPNIELSNDELNNYRTEAENFINAIDMIRSDLYNIGNEPTEIQTLFYDAGKKFFGEEKQTLFRFFKLFYIFLFEREVGPRWGAFVQLYGKENFIEFVESRYNNPFRFPI